MANIKKPRRMSFQKTIAQILDRTKTVTRRTGWKHLRVGDDLIAVDKARGVKAENQRVLARLRVTSVERAPLDAMLHRWSGDAVREGFPKLSSAGFVAMFCKAFKCEPSIEVARITFEYIDEESPRG